MISIVCKNVQYVGILLPSKLGPSERTANACRKEKAAYLALKISKHLNPRNIPKFYTTFVLPSVLFISKVWCDLRQKRGYSKCQHFLH